MATVGLSDMYYAKYAASGATVTYSAGAQLGRASEVDISLDGQSSSVLYLDNGPAEAASSFSGGTATITIGELTLPVAAAILGLSTTSTSNPTGTVLVFGADVEAPYCGIGMVVKGIVNGTATWLGVILPKVQFQQPGEAATTQGQTVTWQTKQLTATILRDDTAAAAWKKLGQFTSRADAVKWVKAQLGIT